MPQTWLRDSGAVVVSDIEINHGGRIDIGEYDYAPDEVVLAVVGRRGGFHGRADMSRHQAVNLGRELLRLYAPELLKEGRSTWRRQ